MGALSARKIIIVGTAYPFRGGGISTFNERLAYEFQENGDNVCIYNFTLQYPTLFFPGKFQKTNEPPSFNLRILDKVNSINPFNWIKIGLELKSLKPDVVIFRFWTPFMAPCFGTIARLIRHNLKTRIISITDNIIPHESSFLDKMLSKYFINSMDGFIMMSGSVFNDLDRLKSHKPKVLNLHPLYDNFGTPVLKEIAISELGLDPSYKYILFFGFIRDYKGLDLLIKALSDQRLRKYKIKLMIAGEFYSDSKPYLKLIEGLGLIDDVILFNNFIPNNSVYKFFCACDVVVQPYKSATQSGVTQVAYHFEKPIITTNVGGLTEYVENDVAGYVVNPEVNQISEAIDNFFGLNKEKEFIENIKRIKIQFSWKTMTETIYKMVDNFQ